jgi:glycosyltransferase involved in cell wall biosynthesis
MKVGVYFHGYPPEKCGGYSFEQEVLLSLYELAHECRHELVVFFEETPGDGILAILAEKGLRTVLIEQPRRIPRLQRLAKKILGKLHLQVQGETPHPLRAALIREKVELIWFEADAYVPVDQVDVPYIATVWDIQHRLQPWFPEVSQSGMWQWRENFYSIFLKRAAFILTPNIVSRKELALFYQLPLERFRIVPYPSPRVDYGSEEIVKDVLKRYQLEPGYLFYPAGFWPHKNHANLLLALQVLKEKFGITKQLVLVGADKGNLEYIRNLTQTLGLEGQAHFLGFVPRVELFALYQGAMALTFMSLCGPENLPPLEAFQCDCPVIVADYSGAREQFGETVLFVNGLDPEAIATAIQELEVKPELRQVLIEKGRVRASQYTGEDYIRDVFKIFDEFEPVRRNWAVPNSTRNAGSFR